MNDPRWKNIGRDCLSLIEKKMTHNITPDEYYIAILELDQKYPMPIHDRSLTKDKYQDYREMGLQPMNFKEAGEMYAHHRKEKQTPTQIDYKERSLGEHEEEND